MVECSHIKYEYDDEGAEWHALMQVYTDIDGCLGPRFGLCSSTLRALRTIITEIITDVITEDITYPKKPRKKHMVLDTCRPATRPLCEIEDGIKRLSDDISCIKHLNKLGYVTDDVVKQVCRRLFAIQRLLLLYLKSFCSPVTD